MTNPVSWLLLRLVGFYRRFLSPLKPSCCRFEPIFSQYALEALQRHGLFRALGLIVWRILRCQPFYHGPVYDPVPPCRKAETARDEEQS